MTVDPYLDPDSGVLRNLLGFDDPERLREAESGLSFAALADLGTRALPGSYDLEHLCAFHREIFGDLYPWAGQVRMVNSAKTQPFCLAQHIGTYAADVFAERRGGQSTGRVWSRTGTQRPPQPRSPGTTPCYEHSWTI